MAGQGTSSKLLRRAAEGSCRGEGSWGQLEGSEERRAVEGSGGQWRVGQDGTGQ